MNRPSPFSRRCVAFQPKAARPAWPREPCSDATRRSHGVLVCFVKFLSSFMVANTVSIPYQSLIEKFKTKAEVRDRIAMLADKAKEEVANKLVIFVDELDRCRPDFAVRLLEQTKNLFKSENIILVFSTDSEQLAYAIGGMYGNGFATSVFLEWFFDERLTLSEVDSFIITSCNEVKNTGSKFTRLVQEVRSKKVLTIRDVLRINRKLESAYMYCLNDASANNELPGMIAACAILPLLVFIQREDTDLFRRITSGADFDAIYEYGKQYDAFNENVRTAIKRSRTAFNEEAPVITNDDIKHFVHKLCVAIYGSPEKTPDYYETRDRMSGFSSPAFNEDVCKRLSFGAPDSE